MRIALDASSITPRQAGVRVYAVNLASSVARLEAPAFDWDVRLRSDLWNSLAPRTRELLSAAEHVTLEIESASSSRFSFPMPVGKNDPQPILTVFPDYYAGRPHRGNHAVVVHDLHFRAHPATFSLAQRAFRRCVFAAHHCSRPWIFTISSETRDELARYYPKLASRAHVIGSGTTIESILPESVTELEGTDYLLTVGTVNHHKNQQALIKAYGLYAHGAGPEHAPELVLVGKPGNDSAAVRQEIAEAKAQGLKIRWLQGLRDEEIAWLYRQARGVILPSTYEGYGLPLAEALVLGIPVACSNLPVFQEVGGHTLHFFDPHDISQIADALYGLANGLIPALQSQRFTELNFDNVPIRIENFAQSLTVNE